MASLILCLSPKMVQLGTWEENIDIFCTRAGLKMGFFSIKSHSRKSGTHSLGIEPVKNYYLLSWIRFIVCKIHHISKNGPKMVQLGT